MNQQLAKTLLETAATLIEEARKLTPAATAQPVDTRTFFSGYNTNGQGWLDMLELWAKEDAARGTLPFNPSLRAGIMGQAGGSFFPKSWAWGKRILDAADRGELNNDQPWPGPDGKPFNSWSYMDKTTEEKHAAVVWVWTCPKGLEWRAHPLNAHLVPKGEPDPTPDRTTG